MIKVPPPTTILKQRLPSLTREMNPRSWIGGHPGERQLDPDHLNVGLALSVDALLEAEADELVLGDLVLEELARLGVEVVELALEDRDDVAGDVLEGLRVLERADTALAA